MVLEWLFKPTEHKGLLMGLDASGKTTLLYQLKCGESLTAIPTIGANVETITHPGGPTLNLWDVGGCDKIRPLIRHYMQEGTFIIFIHDCSDDEERQWESREIFKDSLHDFVDNGCKHVWVVFNKQDLFPRDQLKAILEEKVKPFEEMLSKYKRELDYKVLRLPGFSAWTGDQVDYLADDIRRTLVGKRSLPPPTAPPPAREPTMEELENKIRKGSREMERDDIFWSSFLRAEIQSWDHFTHLRAGYAVLLEGLSWGQSVLTIAETFMEHLERLRSARPDIFRNTAHKTMTVFWLFQIRLATHKYQIDKVEDPEKVPALADFTATILNSPYLMNTGLWKKYYSKDLMFSPNAKEAWRFPDLQPLPTTLPEAQSKTQNPAPTTPVPDRLLRFAFVVVQKIVPTSRRRGEFINDALETWKSYTIRVRARDPTIPPYSVTQAYFWIQLFHHARVSLEHGDVPGLSAALTFDAFKELLELDGEEWRRYYSPELWDSVSARMEFKLPDLAPLPNALVAPPTAKIESAREKILGSFYKGAAHGYKVPPQEDLLPMGAILVCEARDTDPAANEIKTHATLVKYLYTKLVSDLDAKEPHGGMDKEKPRGQSSRATSVALDDLGPYLSGMTARMFWAQQVVAAQTRFDPSRPPSFAQFISGAPHLAWEQLPLVFYSVEMWESQEAAEMFVPPDLRPLYSSSV